MGGRGWQSQFDRSDGALYHAAMNVKQPRSGSARRDTSRTRRLSAEIVIQTAPLVKQAPGGSLADISKRLNVSLRTLRSWMSEPHNMLRTGVRGRWSTYSPEFERRARYVASRLKEIPSLPVVAEEVARLSDAEIEAILASSADSKGAVNESAAEYAARARSQATLSNTSRPGAQVLDWEIYSIVDGVELRVRQTVLPKLRSRLRKLLAEARQTLREPGEIQSINKLIRKQEEHHERSTREQESPV